MSKYPDTTDPEPKALAAQPEPQDVEERKSQRYEAVQPTNESLAIILPDGNDVSSECHIGPDRSKLELGIHSGDIDDQPIQEVHKPGESSKSATRQEKSSRTSINERTVIDHTIADYTLSNHTYHSCQVQFIRDKAGRYIQASPRLKNNLTASVGFLEFGNACDFAANVWNTTPVPKYATVLMGLGGTVALVVAVFAARDGIRSWRNIRVLREERTILLRQSKESRPRDSSPYLHARLEVNRREIGTEIVDRLAMDSIMGFGALLISIGTYMAIGGANPHVYFASNLLSGYVGNAPPAIWGLANTIWCTYILRRAWRHHVAGKALSTELVKKSLKPRIRLLQWHASLMGGMTLVSAAGSLVSATLWYGYVMLIPCIIIFIYDNFLWRNRLGYERPAAGQEQWRTDAVEELEWTVFEGKTLVHSLVSMGGENSSHSIESIVGIVVRCDLFEEFCIRLVKEKPFLDEILRLSSDSVTTSQETLTITPRLILSASNKFPSLTLRTAQSCIREIGLKQLRYKERYLLELVGAYFCTIGQEAGPTSEEPGEK